MRTHHKSLAQGVLAALALLLPVTLVGADTRNTPVQAAGGGATADEYAKKSDLGFQWSGDARVRLDTRQRSDAKIQPRFRTRLRVGAKGTMADQKAFWGFKLATGANEAVSRNLTLAGGDANGNPASFGLDQAYLGLKPHQDVIITLGKMGNPFEATEGIFDGDLTPPGIAVEWSIFKGGKGDLIRNVNNTIAYYFIREIGAVTADPFMVGNQLNGTIGPVDCGLALYYFTGLNAQAPVVGPPLVPRGAAAMEQAGNQTAGGLFPDDNMAVIHGRASYAFKIRDFPLDITGELFNNLAASNQNWGWEVKLGLPKLWIGKGHVLARNVGQFATFSPWADSDLGEGTGYKSGFEAEYAVPVAKNVTAAVSYMRFDRFQPITGAGARTTNRVFFDVSAKF